MNRILSLLAVVSLLVAGTSCGSDFSQKDVPQIYVEIGSSTNPSTFEFDKIGAQDPAARVPVEVWNTGGKPLTVESIELLEGGNAYISVEWTGSVSPELFPVTIEPNLDYPGVTFTLVYDPEEGIVDINNSTLVMTSNDPDFKVDDWKYSISLGIKAIGPAASVNHTAVSFNCVSGCASEEIVVDNEGTDSLTVLDVYFKNPLAEYTIPDPPNVPFEIKRQGDDGYETVGFDVRYCPQDDNFSDDNILVIETNDYTNYVGGIIEIPISIGQSPAILEISTDSAFGYLDFTGEGGTHSVSIYNKAASECDELCADKGTCCGCPIQVIGAEISPSDAKDWYSVVAKDSNGVDKALPYAVKGGGSTSFEVTYARPAGSSEDRNGKLCINYNAPIEGNRNQCFDLIASSQCEFGLAPMNQLLHFGSADATSVKEKNVVLINSGAGACTVSKVWLTDNWDSDNVDDFALDKDGAAVLELEGMELAPFSLTPLTVQFAPITSLPSGKLHITYTDSIAGELETVVVVKGTKLNEECALPQANPGSASLYTNYEAGTTVSLNGCGSLPGTCGSVLYDQGYIWYLLDKPEGSGAYLNDETTCNTSFVPDLAGDYTVGLVVYDAEVFYQSDPATVTFTVEAPAE